MMKAQTLSAFGAAALLLVAQQVSAQGPVTMTTPAMPKWDAGGSAGILFLRSSESGDLSSYFRQDPDLRFEVGRYLTPHLKTELGVSAPNQWETMVNRPAPGFPYAYAQKTQQLTFITPALTYQFYENQFSHPYVSVGARMAFGNARVFRDETTRPSCCGSSNPPGTIDERSTITTARPFFAVGAKNYFDSRTYVRTEVMLAYSSARIAQFAMRLGVGIDF